jgi:hypothetical protein
MSKYGDLIKKAREPETQISGIPDLLDQNSGMPDEHASLGDPSPVLKEREVNLCVKVPESQRRHWAAESKRMGVSMTSVIVDALKAKFGEPG